MKIMRIGFSAALAVLAISVFAENVSWLRPRTTRRYLQPPLSENMFTLWNDGKIIRGDVIHAHDWKVRYADLKSDVFWLVQGKNDEPFDFRAAVNRIPENGTPMHGLAWKKDGFLISLDAFCETGIRNPACFARVTVENEGSAKFPLKLAVMMRRMREYYALNGAPDLYEPYETRFGYFANSEPLEYSAVSSNTWKSASALVRAEASCGGVEWDWRSAALRFSAFPEPGEKYTLTLTFGAHDSVVRPSDWEYVRGRTAGFWSGEIGRINRLPRSIANDTGKVRLIENLTVQMLQCFSHPVGSDLVLPRQGGLQRFVWPWDCKDMLKALGLIGDFGVYVEGALDLYFREYAAEDGRIGPFRNDWVCDTGECLYSLSRYCLDNDRRGVWLRHRDAAFRAFDWMRKKRSESSFENAEGVAGLYPSSCATDNPKPIQLWCFTDLSTLAALKVFAQAASHFGDARAAEVHSEADSLQRVIASIYRKFSEAATSSDEMRIPLTPDGDDEVFRKTGYFDISQGYMLRVGLQCGFVPAGDALKVYNWHLRNGKASERGLCANHPPLKNLSDAHVWYTTASEQHWYEVFRMIGREDLAERVLQAVLKYSVTEEFYVGERYRDDNPWYFPWSPNASGSGRIILMLLNDSLF